jgi:hypothetical protein
MDRWDQELRGAGFAGIDVSAFDKEEPYNLALTIVAKPQLQRNEDTREVTVLCGESGEDLGISKQLVEHLQNQGLEVSTANLGQNLSSAQYIISTLDLESPTFSDLSRKSLEDFQKTMRGIQPQLFLWVMPPVQLGCLSPDAATSLGILRTIRAELALPIITLEISKEEDKFCDILTKFFFTQTNRPPSSETLSPDSEFVVDDGVVKIGRFLPFLFNEEVARKRNACTTSEGRVVLDIEKIGLIDTIRWVEQNEAIEELKDDDVEVVVRAVGMNFKVSSFSTQPYV